MRGQWQTAISIVLIAIPASTVIFFLVNIFFRGEFLNSYFIPDWNDSFMDYFNTMENVRMGDPYYAYANYPPLVFAIFKVLYHIVNPMSIEGAADPRVEAFEMRSFMPTMLTMMLVFLMSCLLISLCIRKMLAGYSEKTKNIFIISFFLSGPFLFLLERGNILIISLALLLIFIAFHDSDNIYLRILGCAALAISAAMKLYPAIFALLLLKEKRYKAFISTAVLGLALFFVPFFFFNGIESMQKFFSGLLLSSSEQSMRGHGLNYSLQNIVDVMAEIVGLDASGIGASVSILGLILSLVIFAKAEHLWQCAFACSLACVWVPAFSYTYSLTMFVPAILRCLSDKEKIATPSECAAILLLLFTQIMFISPVMSLDGPTATYPMYWGCFLGNVAILLAAVLMAWPLRSRNLTIRKARRNASVDCSLY